jgi:hypothetical protein
LSELQQMFQSLGAARASEASAPSSDAVEADDDVIDADFTTTS